MLRVRNSSATYCSVLPGGGVGMERRVFHCAGADDAGVIGPNNMWRENVPALACPLDIAVDVGIAGESPHVGPSDRDCRLLSCMSFPPVAFVSSRCWGIGAFPLIVKQLPMRIFNRKYHIDVTQSL